MDLGAGGAVVNVLACEVRGHGFNIDLCKLVERNGQPHWLRLVDKGAGGIRNVQTLTTHYTEWYADDFIQQAYVGHFVYSPLLKSFVTMPSPDAPRFRAEEYADLAELRALSELIGVIRTFVLSFTIACIRHVPTLLVCTSSLTLIV
ncbi:hypothetical protein ACTXT7_000204 [Hymenolepis weldensis]